MADCEKEILGEAKLSADIGEFYEMNNLNELDSEEELYEAIDTVTKYSKMYRDVHTELKFKMQAGDYDGRYPKYDEVILKLRSFIKEARQKVRALKKNVEDNRQNEAKLMKLTEKEEQKTVLRSEYDFFRAKLMRRLESYDWESIADSYEITMGLNSLDQALDEWYLLHGKIKGLFEGSYSENFEVEFDSVLKQVLNKIAGGKVRMKELLHMREEESRISNEQRAHEEQNKIENEKLRSETEQAERVAEFKSSASNLYHEIKVLNKQFTDSLNIKLKDLGDHYLLDLKKNLVNFTADLREILNKITCFAKLAPYCGPDGESKMNELSKLRHTSATTLTTFSTELEALLRDRDISEEKLKIASSLKVELQKFKGYNSKIDIYTFRKEFEKLIQPVIQKPLLVDYLKMNFLSDSALILVQTMENLDKIWEKLENAFGNMQLILQNKISLLEKQTPLWKLSSDEKIGVALSCLINTMTEVSELATKFELEEELYYGGCLEKILSMMGNARERKFVKESKDSKVKKPKEWARLKIFLEKELEFREKITILNKTKTCMGIDAKPVSNPGSKNEYKSVHQAGLDSVRKGCYVCGSANHARISVGENRTDVPYFACKIFVDMTPLERRKFLFKKRFCAQCLKPGVFYDRDHNCINEYACPHEYHKKFKRGLHVLVCESHKNNKENHYLIDKFRNSIAKFNNLETFSKEISISFSHNANLNASNSGKGNVINDSAIFMLQTINVEGQSLNLFYDTGCADMVIKKSALDSLLRIGRAKLVRKGPITLSGVGDVKSVCEHGAYSVHLPLKGGEEAIISGICLDNVTSEFPKYSLVEVTKDIENMYETQGVNLEKTFPKMPKEVGGETDILLGIKYAKYFPELVHMFPSGLSVYKSAFLSQDGTDGLLGGPHPEFTKAEKAHRGFNIASQKYFHSKTMRYRHLSRIQSEVPLLGYKEEQLAQSYCNGNAFYSFCNVCICKKLLKCTKKFEQIESAGTEISYRCIDCRNCPECKKCPRLENISIQEEAEQSLIDRSVHVDIENQVTTASLPFITEPDSKLVPNEKSALKIYKSQVRKLQSKPNDKIAVIQSEQKLQSLGFVDFFDNLSDDEKRLFENKLHNYIPWRVAWNPNSLSTSVRLVFDASHTSSGGCSLNSLLAKGINSMNVLVEILIRWTTYLYAFHTDIQKMYNSISLKKEHWRYQMYLWRDDLDVERPPRPKVIKSLIYGVKPSGNLAERGLRVTAEKTYLSQRCEFSDYIVDPLKFRFRMVVRVVGLVFLFICKLRLAVKKGAKFKFMEGDQTNLGLFQSRGDKYIITTGSKISPLPCSSGLVVTLTSEMISYSLNYFFHKASAEILEFVDKARYEKISVPKNGILYYSGRILSTQKIGGIPSLGEAVLDLTASTFCVPLSDSDSPIARAITSEVHWYHPDVKHGGVESVLRQIQRISYIIGGRNLVKGIKRACVKCRILAKRAVRVKMGPIQDVNLCIAPAFYSSQVDLCGPFSAYSNANKRATIKIYLVVFCCCVSGAIDCRVMEDYSTDSFLLAFTRFACTFGYPKLLLPDEGSQLIKGCKNMVISFSNIQHKLSCEYGVEFEPCATGAHYIHGKVERKIQQVKKSLMKTLDNNRLSVIQWETLAIKIANSINNLPIGIGNKTKDVENLDILTPNRLILGRNNDRCPTTPLELAHDHKRIIESNNNIFKAWFNSWLISYVPTLIERPKWHYDDKAIEIGDVVLFLKAEQEFNLQYQYGIVISTNEGRDGRVRTIEIEYQNHQEKVKRTTTRGVRDVIVIHRVDELSAEDNFYYLYLITSTLLD